MAWTAPLFWAVGVNVTHVQLNEQLKDNIEFLGTSHNHAGTAGGGSSVLGPINKFIFTDIGVPSVTRTLQGSGTIVYWRTGAGTINLTTANAATGSASLRTLGNSNGTQAADGTHGHVSFGFI